MSNKKPVVVYGASGYTGRLICEYLRELNVPFIAAGRDKARVQAVMDRIPGIETADYEVVGVEHSVKALSDLLKGSKVLCNTVGPFGKLGGTSVEAALAAGCHYVDTTGEQDWMLSAQAEWGDAFAKKNLLLAPCIAQMFTTGEIAANICLETPGLDTLDMLVLWKGFPTYASTQTIFSNLRSKKYFLEENKYAEWPSEITFDVVVPGQHLTALTTPWGGTAAPVWFKDDPRVATCRVTGGVFAREVMAGAIMIQKKVEAEILVLPLAEQDAALAKMADSVQSGMPPRENPRINTSIDSAYASGALGRAHCVIHGNCNYKQTGLLQAYSAYLLLQQPPKRVGFGSACQAFGHRTLLACLRNFGLVMNPIVTVQS